LVFKYFQFNNLTMKQFNNVGGFTLVEILVSIFIIILMSGIIFANYRQGGQQFALQRSANKLAQDIRRAQQMAMSAEEYSGEVPVGGYGIYVEANPNPPYEKEYILFGNRDSDNHQYNSGSDYLIDTIPIEEGITVADIKLDGSSKSKINISFIPPDPQVWIIPPEGGLGSSVGEIILCIIGADCTVPTNIKTITVNRAGLIEIE